MAWISHKIFEIFFKTEGLIFLILIPVTKLILEEIMRKTLITNLALGVALSVTVAAHAASIKGSAHDLSDSNGGAYSETQLCVFCHTPHNSNDYTSATLSAAPLWNHQVTQETSYTLYSSIGSATLNASLGQPGDISKACLSCHDGTIAINAYGGATTGTALGAVNANLGTDLSDDHPVGFTFDTALQTADGELNDPSAAPISGWLFGVGKDQMECATCHDVHNTPGVSYFLRVSNVQSGLCLTCHAK